MQFTKIGFDYDGVIADSRATAFGAVEDIAQLFGISARIDSMRNYRAVFNDLERTLTCDAASVDLLRALHRLIMLTRSASVPLFEEVIAIASRTKVEAVIISSSLRDTLTSRLTGHSVHFSRILAHENGLKEHNLSEWANGQHCLYISDNVHDISHCRKCDIAIVAVGWGFDTATDLKSARPDWFTATPRELDDLLVHLHLIKTP